MKFEITKRFTFEAAHYLEGYDGLCGRIHGHSYIVEVTVSGPLQTDGQERGMVMDLQRLKAIVQPMIDELDHSLLVERDMELPADIPGDRIRVLGVRPTTEAIASILAEDIVVRLPEGVDLVKLRITETATSWVEVRL